MLTATKIGDKPFLAGSTAEGAAYARHLAQQLLQDFDYMIVEATIKSPECLLKLENVPGFVQVKYDPSFITKNTVDPFRRKLNHCGILCINGYQLKAKYCGVESDSIFPRCTTDVSSTTTTFCASTEAKFKSILQATTLSEQFEITLADVERLRAQTVVREHQPKFIAACNALRESIASTLTNVVGQIADYERLHQKTFEDVISLLFPMYYIRMPAVNQERINALLSFYEKYKHLGNEYLLDEFIEYGLLSMNNEADLVPALKLDFWPDEIQLFLDRIRVLRPDLHQVIQENGCMHVIPKWSRKTPQKDEQLEFRYSFSAIELMLARKRTRFELILNGVARSIYYRYLKKAPSVEDATKVILPSYFVKTTVLWMCEENIMGHLCSEKDDDQTVAIISAQQWIKFAISRLREGSCSHYFIDGLNLLEVCSRASLDRAIEILENQVTLNEVIKIDVLSEQQEFMAKRMQTTENWIHKMKVKDILAAINDYRLLRERWLCPPENNTDIGDTSSCLYVLNQMRSLDGKKQTNWDTFRRLFMSPDQNNWLQPIWDDGVAETSVCDFVDSLIAASSTMQKLLEAMKVEEFEENVNKGINLLESLSFQNILNDLIQPNNMLQNGMMNSWLPMFTTPYFNRPPMNITSMTQRSIFDNHPVGPFQNLLQGLTPQTALGIQGQQTYQEHTENVSDQFLRLLHNAPNMDMTLEDLIKYYNRPSTTAEHPVESHATNSSLTNKEMTTLMIFDTDHVLRTITDDMYRCINDYVLIYETSSQLPTFVQSIKVESIFVIICQSSLNTSFLSQLNNLNQIHSIFIYSTQTLPNEPLKNQFSKLVGIFTEPETLLQKVKWCIDYPSVPLFRFYDPQQKMTPYTMLSRQNAIFFWNLLLKDLLETYDPQDKFLITKEYKEYYRLNIKETENIKAFEQTYIPATAYEWCSKSCFMSKLLSKAFRYIDVELLKSLNFFIRDLISSMEITTNMEYFYCSCAMGKARFEKLREIVGQLIIFNGFLFAHTSPFTIEQYPNTSQVTVIFKINNSLVPCKAHMIDSNCVIIDFATVFQVNSIELNDASNLWTVNLACTNEGLQIAQEFIAGQHQVRERMTLPLIMGDLLFTCNDISIAKSYFENLKGEDEALIYFYLGRICHVKGEYDAALELLQTANLLMSTGDSDRIEDSAEVLHTIGYAYDMKEDFDNALARHQEALNIREAFCSENDVRLGLSLYNVGRTLVNMKKHHEALPYHEKALKILEEALTCHHPHTIRSIHSNGIVYLGMKENERARSYLQRALSLYEANTPDDEYVILMIKQALDQISENTMGYTVK